MVERIRREAEMRGLIRRHMGDRKEGDRAPGEIYRSRLPERQIAEFVDADQQKIRLRRVIAQE